jgi:hypothetical protein
VFVKEQHMRKTIAKWPVAFLSAVSMAMIVLTSAVPPAFGWINPDTDPFRRLFAAEEKLSADGRRLVVTGTADCAAADGQTQVSVSILQHESLAAARGFSKIQPCTDTEDSFTAELTVREGKPSFTAGPVQACAMAQMGTEDGPSSYDFWCTFVTLVVDDTL